ncbi:jg15887 [Pararge aegeria aegeria]|uniref:Jg15887 protein n=1 Tax=Pararge aegeria aegeria TaxID=348720 RepID=A0A8S4SLR7_9NEOP|nr:jg15887 [Pararge aegeria aegeria]
MLNYGFIMYVAHKPLHSALTSPCSFQYKPLDKHISLVEDHKFQIHFSSIDEAPSGRARLHRPERLEEEYYPRDQYQRYPRDYPREYHEGYSHDYPHGDPYEREREAYGHDYTRDYPRDYPREPYPPREERGARPRDRETSEEYGASRRALNAV